MDAVSTVSPRRTVAPSERSALATSPPSISIPLAEFRSTIRTSPGAASTLACRFETSGSVRMRSARGRVAAEMVAPGGEPEIASRRPVLPSPRARRGRPPSDLSRHPRRRPRRSRPEPRGASPRVSSRSTVRSAPPAIQNTQRGRCGRSVTAQGSSAAIAPATSPTLAAASVVTTMRRSRPGGAAQGELELHRSPSAATSWRVTRASSSLRTRSRADRTR